MKHAFVFLILLCLGSCSATLSIQKNNSQSTQEVEHTHSTTADSVSLRNEIY